MPETKVWSGDWVAQRLGFTLEDEYVRRLVGLAIRPNPKRAHLLVSNVLGKHVPQHPSIVYGTGLKLGARVRALLCDSEARQSVVIGYAETATGLGHAVADALDASIYLHSTRRATGAIEPMAAFQEVHSHATAHFLLPESPSLFAEAQTVVLVDDELSTGKTVINTIRTLHSHAQRRYVVATLVDVRPSCECSRMSDLAQELGVRIDVVALAYGDLHTDATLVERAQRLVSDHSHDDTPSNASGSLARLDLAWPLDLPEGGRHGFTSLHRARMEHELPGIVEQLQTALGNARRVLVLGSEELMYVPVRIAAHLEQELHGTGDVFFSSTTRSPALAVDDASYAIRTRLAFPRHDGSGDSSESRFAYNVAPGSHPEPRFDAIVLIVDSASDTTALHAPGGLLDKLRRCADRAILAVIPSYIPRNGRRPLCAPEFSSYRGDEVLWLLKDVSSAQLEKPTRERETGIQSGRSHYAESLPIEYRPTREYLQLYHTALSKNAERIAHAVGVVAETILEERGPQAVLVSLARAGTPIAILIRRWIRMMHGLDLPHYAISIIRGRGIDLMALRYLAEHHAPEDVTFIDGWTGKGAITRELCTALSSNQLDHLFNPEVAVLADPGGCSRTFGTREDLLIPSACLNSTVCGLVSRTVMNTGLLGETEFHGAKFYRDLSATDESNAFLDRVSERFHDVRASVDLVRRTRTPAERTPDWRGWRMVEQVAHEYRIGDVNWIKPGIGETTRVLLRRVPWRILVHRYAVSDVDHICLLAAERGVPVEERDDIPYAAIGLVKPLDVAQ